MSLFEFLKRKKSQLQEMSLTEMEKASETDVAKLQSELEQQKGYLKNAYDLQQTFERENKSLQKCLTEQLAQNKDMNKKLVDLQSVQAEYETLKKDTKLLEESYEKKQLKGARQEQEITELKKVIAVEKERYAKLKKETDVHIVEDQKQAATVEQLQAIIAELRRDVKHEKENVVAEQMQARETIHTYKKTIADQKKQLQEYEQLLAGRNKKKAPISADSSVEQPNHAVTEDVAKQASEEAKKQEARLLRIKKSIEEQAKLKATLSRSSLAVEKALARINGSALPREKIEEATKQEDIEVATEETPQQLQIKEAISEQSLVGEVTVTCQHESAPPIGEMEKAPRKQRARQRLEKEAVVTLQPPSPLKDVSPLKKKQSKITALDEQIATALIKQTMEQELVKETAVAIPRRANKFFERTQRFEHQHLAQVVNMLNATYQSMSATRYNGGSRYRRDPEDFHVDYATAHINNILQARTDNQLDELRQQMNKPYFARMDVFTEKTGETFYIAQTAGTTGDAIISWKSPVASLFYLKTVGVNVQHETLGKVEVDYIQQFLIRDAKIRVFHEPLMSEQTANKEDKHLVNKLAEKKGGTMSEIVATIQKEQYEMIALPMNHPIIIQGSAGSGKSAIALHRLSYLLYQSKNLKASSVAIIGPNEAFLTHIRFVLPTLGDYNVKQFTYLSFAQAVLQMEHVQLADESSAAQVKGSLLFSKKVEQFVQQSVNRLQNWRHELTVRKLSLCLWTFLEKQDETKHLQNKDRENLYFNYILANYRQQMDRENEMNQQIQAQLNHIVQQIVDEQIRYPQLTEHLFLSDLITSRMQRLKDSVAQGDKEKMKTYYQFVTTDIKKYIAEEISKWTISKTIQLDDVLALRWERHAECELIRAKNTFLVAWLERSEATHFSQLLQNNMFRKQWEEKLLHTEAMLKQAKSKLFRRWQQQYAETVFQNSKYEVEKRFLQAIREQFKQLSKENYQLTIFPQGSFKQEPLLKIEEADYVQIKAFVKKHVKRDVTTLYAQFLKQQYLPVGPLAKEDMAPLLHIHRLLNGVSAEYKLKYLIIDEAQDYMPYEIQELSKLTEKNGIMLIGDLGQNLNPHSSLNRWSDYDELLEHPSYFELSATYRSTKQIVKVSNRIIEPFATYRYELPKVAYRDGETVKWVRYKTATEEANRLLLIINKALKKTTQVAVILKDAERLNDYMKIIEPHFSSFIQTGTKVAPDDRSVIVTTVKDAKGLEFETVIVVDFNAYTNDNYNRKLAYVATSRALHELFIFYHSERLCALK